MGTINNRFQYVWYGTCEQEECSDFIFADNMDLLQGNVESISGFNVTGDGLETFIVGSSDPLGPFNRMRCGTMYAIVLEPTSTAAGSEVTIPNMEAAGTESRDVAGGLPYKVSFDCSTVHQEPTPTPTPTLLSCVPSTHSEITITGAFYQEGNHSFFNFGTGDKVGLNYSEFVAGLKVDIILRIAGVEGESWFTLTDLELTGANTTIYWLLGQACYRGVASTSNATVGSSYIVNMA